MFIDYETTIDATTLYGSYINFSGLDYEAMQQTFLSNSSYNKLYPQTNLVTKGVPIRSFFFVTTIPLWNEDYISGCIITVIDTDTLLGAVENSLPDESFFYFYDSDRTLIASSQGAPTIQMETSEPKTVEQIGGIDYIVYRTTAKNARNYAVAIPYSTATRSLTELKMTIYVAFGLSVLVCGAMALYFTKLNYRPIAGFVETLSGYTNSSQETKDEYTFISNAMNQLITSDLKSQTELEQNLPILRANFVRSVTTGELLEQKDLQQHMKQLKLDLNAKEYRVILVSVLCQEPNSVEQLRRVIDAKRELCVQVAELVPSLYSDGDELSVVFLSYFNDADADDHLMQIESAVNQMSNVLYTRYGFKLKAAVSRSCQDLTELFYVYQEAKSCLNSGIQTEYGHTVWCAENILEDMGYYYPPELELCIINAFRNNNIQVVWKTLDMLQKENEENRIVAGHPLVCLYYNIKSTVFKILFSANASTQVVTETETRLSAIQMNLPLSDFFETIKQILTQLHESVTHQDHPDLAAEMLNFVDVSYKNPQFCRQLFSEHFHISEDYTSRFFKEHTGYRFNEYLTKVRMEAASKLLLTSQYTIKKIAAAVGYTSDMSFRRAFKAHFGMSPIEYRENRTPSDKI